MKQIVLFLLVTYTFYGQEIDLLQQFNGTYDFTMIGNTLNPSENESATNCSIYTSSSANLNLQNTDVIEKAYLYWAGSGTGDLSVLLNNSTIDAERVFTNFSFGYSFFGCFADVTTIVQNTGNGQYVLSELNLNNIISNYCQNGINFGGWAMIIVYKNDNLPTNQLNIYDGLESVYAQNPELNITINNLNVIDNTGAKIGFLAWEGDASLSVNETLKINGNIVSNPPLNPPTNVFNGTNSFTGASNLYNMDLDYYSLDNYIQIGDTQATITLTSGQDLVFVNAIVTKLNSQLPDATVQINNIEETDCVQQEFNINFTVFNNNGTGNLPANTPISLYINGNLNTIFYTPQEIELGNSLDFNEIIRIDTTIIDSFDILLVVDDDGTGNSTVIEFDENNNLAQTNFQFTANCFPVIPQLFTPNAPNNTVFEIQGITERFTNFELYIYNRYGNLIFKGNKDNPTWNGKYKEKQLPTGTYYYTLYLHDADNTRYKGWVYLLN